MSNRRVVLLFSLLSLSTGCAATVQEPPRWERRQLAPGVELHVRSDASPSAQSVADDVEREFRSRHLSER